MVQRNFLRSGTAGTNVMLRGGVLVVGAAGASHNSSLAATSVKPDPGA